MFDASDRAKRIAARAALSMAGVGGAAIAVGLVFSLVLSSRLTRPVRLMSAATDRVGEGNYDARIGVSSKDELGRLAESFNSMVARLDSYNRLNIGKIVEEKRKSDALIRSIDDGIILINDQLQVTNMNPAAERIFGLRFDQSEPRHLLEIVTEPQLLAQVKEAAHNGSRPSPESGAPTISLERDGALRYYQSYLTPVLAPERKRLGIVLVLRDITRLKEIERLKDEFMMAAAHELKTPLTGIAMSIGLLREGCAGRVDERVGELLDVAEADVGRLRSLVSDLLDLSKLESGSIALQFESVPAETLIERACALLRIQAAEKSVHLSWAVEEQTDWVRAEPSKIDWVLTNLISNALRYTASGGHVEVKGRRAGGFVYFSVADDGVGIPPEHQSRIFDKFAQFKAGAREGGTGLGLAICREIIRAHGGTIWVESEVGKGSVFTFAVPVEGKRQ
jgi:NtrC-family two-component system sensor histidine kinase KinB